MMLNFNILPQEEKNRIQTYRMVKILGIWGGTLFLLIMLALLLLIPSYLILALQRDDVLRNLEITEESPFVKRADAVRIALSELHTSAEDIQKITESSGVFSSIFADLLKAVPPGIILTNIKFDGITSELVFAGFAKTRSLLVEMEAALKNIERMKDVAIPLTSLVLNANIPFTIKLKIEPR